MTRRALARSSLSLAVAATLAGACGHLPFDELPLPAEALDGAVGPDGTTPDADADVIHGDGGDETTPPLPDATVGDGGADGDADACADCGVIYVAVNAGAPDNPGTADAPVDSIALALALVSPTRTEIRVAAGHYRGPIEVRQDLVIRGGYVCDQRRCRWDAADPAQDTVVDAADFGGALRFNDKVTRATVVENLHLRGKQGGSIAPANEAGAITVAILGGSPTLKQCTIDGSTVSGGVADATRRSSALFIAGASNQPEGPLVEGCTITGGEADGEATGILMEISQASLGATGPTAEISGCTIAGGTAPASYAIKVNDLGPQIHIHDNTIQATPSNANGGAAGETWGIYLRGSALIDRNRINVATNAAGGDYCKTQKTFCGGIRTENATATIWNNVVLGVPATNSAALLIGTSAFNLGSVDVSSNVLDGRGIGDGASTSASIVLDDTNVASNTVGEVRNNIMLGGAGKSAYCVYEDDMGAVTSHLEALEYNDLAAAKIYREYVANGPAKEYAFTDVANIPPKSKDGNINADCPLDAFHLKPGSPCKDKGTTAKAPATDFDTPPDPRDDHPDIGADETK